MVLGQEGFGQLEDLKIVLGVLGENYEDLKDFA